MIISDDDYYNFRVVVIGFISSPTPKNEIQVFMTLDPTLYPNIFSHIPHPRTSCSIDFVVDSENICNYITRR